jgi:hypothetical protein
MFTPFITKTILAVSMAAVVATVATFVTAVVPEANADTQVSGALLHIYSKGDRLSALRKGSACAHSWPHYEHSCQFDLRKPANEVRTIRVIADR